MTQQGSREPASKKISRLGRHTKFILIVAFLSLAWRLSTVSTQAAVVPSNPVIPRTAVANSTIYKIYLPLVNSNYSPPSPKKGLAWTYQYCQDAIGARAAWVYDWGMNPKICNTTIESIPMIRDASQWAETKQVGGNSEWILGFNEPDLCPDQACLTPAQAVPLWHEIEAQFPNRKLVAPVPSQLHLDWLVQFRNAYIAAYGKPPRFDALAMHWYGFHYTDAEALINWYKARASEFGVTELWLTEFAFPIGDNSACGGVLQSDAMQDAQRLISEMNNDPMIAHYGWYAPRIDTGDPLIAPNPAPQCNAPLYGLTTGTPTKWGTLYQSY